jgi:hypothetical protein
MSGISVLKLLLWGLLVALALSGSMHSVGISYLGFSTVELHSMALWLGTSLGFYLDLLLSLPQYYTLM